MSKSPSTRRHPATDPSAERIGLRDSLERALRSGDRSAWIHLAAPVEIDRAADELEGRASRGEDLPLRGLPFAVKDNLDVAGWPTTAGCPGYAYTPADDSQVVARLRAAGAVPIGKTNLDQFATGLVGTRSPYGACRNVFDPDRIAGGSSSGSAVAVALGHVAFALGTDTAGSGRIPASFANIVGLKPTRGLWSTRGLVPACRSLDCVSVLANSCVDAAAVWRAVTALDPDDPYSRAFPVTAPRAAPASFRFGIPPQVPYLAPGWQPLWKAAVARLEACGGTVVEIDFAPFAEAARILYEGPWVAERWEALGTFVSQRPEAVHPTTRAILLNGRDRSAAELFASLHRLEQLRRRAEEVFRSVDVIFLPTAGRIPALAELETDPHGPNAFLGRGTNFCNLLDLAAIAVPAGFDRDGHPFGTTLFAPAFHDLALLDIGARLHHRLGLAAGRGGPVPPAPPAPTPDEDRVSIAVAGLHLSGEPLNHELADLGGRLERAVRTAPLYRMFRLRRGERTLPGLVLTPSAGGAIEIEIWSLPAEGAGRFLSCVRPPLCLGTLALEDGGEVKGFLCEPWATDGAEDITAAGSWRRAK